MTPKSTGWVKAKAPHGLSAWAASKNFGSWPKAPWQEATEPPPAPTAIAAPSAGSTTTAVKALFQVGKQVYMYALVVLY